MVKTEPPITVDRDLRLWLGGPVDPQKTWVLMAEAHGPEEEQREICPGVLLSVSHALTMQLLQTPPTARATSSWLMTDVDPQLIFGVPADEMWETAIRRLGADPAALQMSPGVH